MSGSAPGGAGPKWFTIPPDRPFLDDLAAGILSLVGEGGPERLISATVLTPTRRAARALADGFLRASGDRALLLPQILALGDLDEGEPPFEPGALALDLPPAISAARRRFELAAVVKGAEHLLERRIDAAGALEYADALAAFLDSLAIEEARPDADIDRWVDGAFARHWRISARFLALALRDWPARLADLGLIDVAERRVRLLRGLAERWRQDPPAGLVVAAGSTGAAPATAALLAAIAAAPQGYVVLPGLDQDLADRAWRRIDAPHPQGAMKRLLQFADWPREQVRPWPASGSGSLQGRWRRRLVNEALRPADDTADWLEQIAAIRADPDADGRDPIADGLAGLSLVRARNEEHAAACAALLLRETLETPERTAALVTPDAALARRVSARLSRWGISAESSAGAPLSRFPAAVLARLIATLICDPADPWALLGVAKHPLARLGLAAEERRTALRALERHGVRGPRREALSDVARALGPAPEAARGLALQALGALEAAIARARAPFEATGAASAAQAAEALAAAMELVAAGAEGEEPAALWSGSDGEAMVRVLTAFMEESEALAPVEADRFADLLQSTLAAETVRATGASHPRIQILGAIEARLVRADRMILAGLEEGVWPAPPPTDPFLSRPLRERAGLPPPERRIGLSAHDFVQCACGPETILVHTEQRGGAPTVASRWLWRLETLAAGAGLEIARRRDVETWAAELDGAEPDPPPHLRPAPRPRPTPPVEHRPRELPVTAVETWVRDPYAIYAGRILGLRRLDRPGEPVDARARGSAVHAALEQFARDFQGPLDASAEPVFAGLLVEALQRAGAAKAQLPRERALARNLGPWVVAFEARRRDGAHILIEQKGRLSLETPGGPFVLTAKADRIEVRTGGVDIIDFKTGAPPSKKQVRSGLSPQLTLTAAIVAGGGFEAVGARVPGKLTYVRITGGAPPGEERVVIDGGESAAEAEAAIEGLRRRLRAFDLRETGYVSWALPELLARMSGDFDHLARLWEWHVMGETGPEAGGEGASDGEGGA